jgi:hypothetical protein
MERPGIKYLRTTRNDPPMSKCDPKTTQPLFYVEEPTGWIVNARVLVIVYSKPEWNSLKVV